MLDDMQILLVREFRGSTQFMLIDNRSERTAWMVVNIARLDKMTCPGLLVTACLEQMQRQMGQLQAQVPNPLQLTQRGIDVAETLILLDFSLIPCLNHYYSSTGLLRLVVYSCSS